MVGCLLVYLIEGVVYQGELALSLIFIVNLAPIYIISNFLMHSFGLKLNLYRYLFAALFVVILAIFNNTLSLPFIVLAMPICIVASSPFFEAIYVTFVTKKNEANFIQKLMAGIVFTSGIICCLNYAINRLTPGAELLGFGTGFLTYLTAAIILPVFTIQQMNKEKTQRLEFLVQKRTEELHSANIQNEKLLRVVIHDISNALQALIYHNSRLVPSIDTKVSEISNKILININSISEITNHLREMARAKSNRFQLAEVEIQDCLNEVRELFIERFNKKNIELHILNNASIDVFIKVERVMFIHTILSNIVSNALKFSHPGSEVIMNVYESKGKIFFDILDYGIGMSEKTLNNLFEHEINVSVLGTSGERGSGLGMPLVKTYTELFGGMVEAFSTEGDELSGTKIVVSFPAFYGKLLNK